MRFAVLQVYSSFVLNKAWKGLVCQIHHRGKAVRVGKMAKILTDTVATQVTW